MQLLSYIDDLHRQLMVAAEAGGSEARALAERLVAPLESAARLMLLEALSAAADELTQELAPGSVEVRLRGTDPEFVVALPPVEPAYASSAEQAPMPPADAEGSTIRTTLRLPDGLKSRMERAAARDGVSVNTWLVRAVSDSLSGGGRSASRDLPASQSYTGWVR